MKKTIISLLLFSVLAACSDKDMFKDIHVNVDTSMPAGSLNYTDQSLLNLSELGKVLVVNSEGVLSVVHSNTIGMVDPNFLDRFFTFPQQNLAFGYDITLPIDARMDIDLGSGIIIPLEFSGLDNGEIVKEMTFSGGAIDLTLDNVPPSAVENAVWSIPQLKDSQGRVVSGKFGQSLNLKDMTLTPVETNKIELVITGRITPVSRISGALNLRSDGFTKFVGWVGRHDIAVDPVSVEFGKEFEEFNKYVGEAYFADPRIKFTVNNEIGVPIMLSIDNFNIGGKVIKLKNTIGSSRFLIEGNATTSILIDNASTVDGNELSLAIVPTVKNLKVDFSAVANPSADGDGAPNPTQWNVITKGNGIDGNYAVELPMDGWFRDIKFEENIASIELKDDKITYNNMVMAFTGTNAMPLDIELMSYAGTIAQENKLFDKPIVIPSSKSVNQPAILNKDNMAVANINKQAIDNLIAHKKLMFQFKASTRGAAQKERTKFYSPSSIKLNVFMGAKADIVIN